MRRLIGILLALHGLAHALSGMRALDSSRGLGPTATWAASLSWTMAAAGFLAAGFGAFGVPLFRKAWRKLAGIAALSSIALLGVLRPEGATAGLAIDLLILVMLWAAWRRPALPPWIPEDPPSRRLGVRVARASAAVLVAYLAAIVLMRPWYMSWGTSRAELTTGLPGDELAGGPVLYQIQHAVTVQAPVDSVWPWLAQMGQDRGGFYSYDWLENLFGLHLRNAERVHPEWQGIAAGDTVFSTPRGWLGFNRRFGWEVAQVEAGRALVLWNWGAFVLQPNDDRTTRFIIRTRGSGPARWWDVAFAPLGLLVFEPAHFIMQRKMLLEIKQRAEEHRDRPFVIGWRPAA